MEGSSAFSGGDCFSISEDKAKDCGPELD